jgi:two-component system sensor histidine kinase CreC
MRLGIRLLFAFFLINGIAAFFVLRVFMAEIKPSVREVMEDMMVDTANLLAELASEDLAAGRWRAGRTQSPLPSGCGATPRGRMRRIWGFSKQSLDYRVYVTDAQGPRAVRFAKTRPWAADYSQWRDVARTLRGEYGARIHPRGGGRRHQRRDACGRAHLRGRAALPGC